MEHSCAHVESPRAPSERLVLLRGGGIGDVYVMGPALASLRVSYPQLEVVGIGRGEVLRLLASEGLLARALDFESDGCWRLYNAGVECPAELREILAQASCWISFGFGRPRADLELSHLRGFADFAAFPAGKGMPVWRHVLGVLRASFPLIEASLGPWNASRRIAVASAGEDACVVLHPGGGAREKRWPLERFLALADRLESCGEAVLFLLGEAEGDALEGALRGRRVARLSLAEVAAVLDTARGYVGNDSGISHLAAGRGIPAIALFGASDPALWAPCGPRALALGERGSWPGEQEVWEAVQAHILHPRIDAGESEMRTLERL